MNPVHERFWFFFIFILDPFKTTRGPFLWPKIELSGEFTGKMVAIGSGHFGDPPRGQMAKNLFSGSFSRETFWQNCGHRKWPLWGPSPRPNGQKFILCQKKVDFCMMLTTFLFYVTSFFWYFDWKVKWWPWEVATLGSLMATILPECFLRKSVKN